MAAASTESPGKCLKKLRVLKSTPEQQLPPPKPKDVLDSKRNLVNAFDATDAGGHKDPWDFVLTSFTLDSFVIFQRDPTSCTPNLKDPKECTLSAGFYHLICWNCWLHASAKSFILNHSQMYRVSIGGCSWWHWCIF